MPANVAERGSARERSFDALSPYAEFARVGFVNILAFRLRYFTGIITYFLNVTMYYFIWSAVLSSPGQSIAGYNLRQMITYVSVGWIIRSFYWNTIDQEIAYEVIEGKITMDLTKPVSIPWMWICRAIGESAFRLGLLTASDGFRGRLHLSRASRRRRAKTSCCSWSRYWAVFFRWPL